MANIGTNSGKRKFEDAGDADAADPAEMLLTTLRKLRPFQPMDWVFKLSDAQFDMLLALRLYTGALYRFMARVHEPIQKNETLRMLRKAMQHSNHVDAALYFAVCNWWRRVRGARKDSTPLLVSELGEDRHLNITEADFRSSVAEFLTDYGDTSGRGAIDPDLSTASKLTELISGTGSRFEALRDTKEFGGNWEDNRHAIAQTALRHFWEAMGHTASALQALILKSDVVADGKPTPVYRGMQEEFDVSRASRSLVSVSTSEETARHFTRNPVLYPVDGDASNQCCMIRITLLPGTPYLDVDAVLRNAAGWGFNIDENELILPAHLEWTAHESDDQVATFPEEIDESDDTAERHYDVTYFKAGPITHRV